MVYSNYEIIQKQVICRAMLRPIICLDEAVRRIGGFRVALQEVGASKEHQRVVDSLHQRTLEAVNILVDTYNGLVTGIDNFCSTDISRAFDDSEKRLGDFKVIERDIDIISQIVGLYNFKRNPILQIMGLEETYDPKACLESVTNN